MRWVDVVGRRVEGVVEEGCMGGYMSHACMHGDVVEI